MGYTTYFGGTLSIDPPLTKEQVTYLNKFSDTRRIKRDPAKLANMPDPIREAVNLPAGVDGGYYVGSTSDFGQDEDAVTNYNSPPSGQPSLWCQWVVSDDGSTLEWDGGEKFYEYGNWLRYLIEHFFSKWGRTLEGEISWQGEESDDRGVIYVHRDGYVEEVFDNLTNPGPSWGK